MKTEDDIKKAVEVMRNGGIILYPTDTIWGRCCICLMSVCSMLAATAARKPTARLSINVNCLLVMCLVRHSMNWFSSADIFSCMICSSSLSLSYLMIFTSPFSDSFMMLDGLWGLCSCLLDQHT